MPYSPNIEASEPQPRPLPRIDHTGGHKPSQYHPVIGRVICERVGSGETVKQVAADPDMPSYVTLYRWLQVHPDFAEMYGAMRARVAAYLVEKRDIAHRSKRLWPIHKAKVDGRRPRDWVSGKKTTYTRAWGQAYCDRIAEGESGMAVSADPAMPSAKQVYRWLRRFPEFRAMYMAARRAQQFGLELDIHMVVDQVQEGLISLTDGKREAARLQGRMGRLGPKVWMRA